MVGRSADAEISIIDPSISRSHLHIACDLAEAEMRIRDLGSSNGTRLRGQRIDPNVDYDIEPGDFIELGASTLVVQRGAADSKPRRRWNHGYFELRLEEECALAKSEGSELAVLRLKASGGVEPKAIEETLSALLGPRDLLALYAPGEYEVLLVESSPQVANQAADGIRFGLSRLGAEVEVGLAFYPRDAQTPDVLVARAGEGVHGPSPAHGTDVSPGFVVEDRKMRQLYELVERIAKSDISVMILGETGTGKEVMSRTVHERSPRVGKPFLALNCGAFPLELLESELFGHERGAFTGAHKAKIGLLETANEGTVFLDEIGDMALSTQVKFLRVIEERRLRRIGGIELVRIDVRFVAATNRDLERDVRSGRFREDLYYRLNGIALVIPPLRERTGEIPLLAKSFAHEARRRAGYQGRQVFDDAAMSLLLGYAWPGNIRELKNVIERAVVLAGAGTIAPEHLPVDKLSSSVIFGASGEQSGSFGLPTPAVPTRVPTMRPDTMGVVGAETLFDVPLNPLDRVSLLSELEEIEKRRIVETLDRCGGNQTHAARELGMTRKVLINRIERYEIPRPRKGH